MKHIVALVALLFVACGYVPVASFSDKVFGEGVYVQITMDPQLPEASVGAKDAINLAVLTRLNNSLASKQSAQTIIDMRVLSVSSTPVAYDNNGFVSHYRATVSLSFNVRNKNGTSFNASSSGYYDYAASSTSALLIEESKLGAVSNATVQALDKFISQVAYQAAREDMDKRKKENARKEAESKAILESKKPLDSKKSESKKSGAK
ncbi:LPS assembly lipoprotein LptE [uncultured Helicobacter sp.]|uniref:LPS assembly lipoprotein LptE n=1 Tax=uncultured Helicobacter sp. TaxID=175537 RepID=UPI0037523887